MFTNPRFQLALGGILLAGFLVTLGFSNGGTSKRILALVGIYVNPDVSPSPSESASSMVTNKVTPMVTVAHYLVSPTMSPSLSPMSLSVSPIITAISVIPTMSPLPSTSKTPPAGQTPLPNSPTPTAIPSAMQGSVVINEIAWMGTSASSDDEWIELYNSGSQPVSLKGWHLAASDGSPNIALDGNIGQGSYYVIKRTDATTIPDVQAGLIAPFGRGLSNSGEDLALLDASGGTQDRVNAAGGWFAGNNADKATMERLDPAMSGSLKSNWATHVGTQAVAHDAAGNLIKGTPGARNSVAAGL